VAAAALDELTRVALRELDVQGALSRDALTASATVADERTILAAWRDYFVAALALIPEMSAVPTDLAAPIAAAQAAVRERADAIIGALTK
jgi:hypothetical protein